MKNKFSEKYISEYGHQNVHFVENMHMFSTSHSKCYKPSTVWGHLIFCMLTVYIPLCLHHRSLFISNPNADYTFFSNGFGNLKELRTDLIAVKKIQYYINRFWRKYCYLFVVKQRKINLYRTVRKITFNSSYIRFSKNYPYRFYFSPVSSYVFRTRLSFSL